jgi:hypothetical protein
LVKKFIYFEKSDFLNFLLTTIVAGAAISGPPPRNARPVLLDKPSGYLLQWMNVIHSPFRSTTASPLPAGAAAIATAKLAYRAVPAINSL